jgi:aminobenzoyl-glutamate utilization protein B
MTSANIAQEKLFAFDVIERNREALALLSDSIFYFGEIGPQETETARLMTKLLEDEGFTVTRGISGFPTGFLATFGSGAPVIAIHTEYDANPDNSQAPGVAERSSIVPGAPGHCEGHNVNGAVLVASAIAIKRAMARFGLPGTLKVFGAPAEEQLLSRPYFVRDGHFDDVDVAFHEHLGGELNTVYGLTHSALISAKFIFHGETSHAGVAPWKGRDALDAVVLMDVGMAQYREHMKPDMRICRVITEGGDQPNVIPARASIWWHFRDPSAEGARKLFEQGKQVAQGAAQMTNTTVEVDVISAVWPVRANQGLAEVLQRNVDIVGMPEWTAEEQALARAIQAKAGVAASGLKTMVTPLKGPAAQGSPCNDCGDVSWAVPMGRLSFPANIPDVPYHNWTAGVALATPIAHKGAAVGAKALAGAIVDLLMDPALVQRAKDTFRDELGGVTYRPLLPAGQKPPIDLHRDLMEQWRPKMREHYLKREPVFV